MVRAYVSTIVSMTGLSEVDGSILEGVSATTLWTLHYRPSEAKRSDGVIRNPWAVTPCSTRSPMTTRRTADQLLEAGQ
jgi:hypothetical protein